MAPSAATVYAIGIPRRDCLEDDEMNWSMYTADRTTHLKIVVVGLFAALVIAVIGISATQLNLGVDVMSAQGPQVYKAGQPVVMTVRDGTVIR